VDTFGFQTARHIGVDIVKNLMVDAKTTSRWYFVIAMGRKAGHLALGIGKAAGATLTLIPEEFSEGRTRLKTLVDILVGSILKRLSYGRRYALERDSTVATVPVGYGDGYPRALGGRAEVLIGGRRHRVAGTVTMDQLLVDCGDAEVAAGEEVVLLGAQGAERITAEELAGHLGTIGYEIVTAISERVPREYVG